MIRKRHTPEQIIRKLRTAEQLLSQGQSVADVCRALEVAAPNYHRWQQLYGGMKATEAKRLKELDQENARLKRLLADAELDKAMLKELAEGASEPGARPQSRVCSTGSIPGVPAPCLPSGGSEPQHPAPARTGDED